MRLIKLRPLVAIVATGITFHAVSTLAENKAPPTFSLGEHAALGDEIKLSFSKTDPGQAKISIRLPNGASLTYGEIVTLGDFYADIGKPISKGENELDRKARFMAAFSTFAFAPAAPAELDKIKSVIQQEQTIVNERMKNGEEPEAIYKSISDEMGRQLNCATGGGCSPNTWWLNPGRYLNVAKENYDHFGNDAILAYTAGHQAAIDQAMIARASGNRNDLALAYAMNAYACHFLSDRFAGGHIRTARNHLASEVTPDVVGSLLAGYMHNEEGKMGIHVHNQHDQQWISYGDWSYFSKKNEYARKVINEAMQISADEIKNAYLYGDNSSADETLTYFPYPNEVNNNNNVDISPMFYWDADNKKLLRRQSLTDKFDRHWTDSWWGWSTLSELKALDEAGSL